jgi:hypothetical protein
VLTEDAVIMVSPSYALLFGKSCQSNLKEAQASYRRSDRRAYSRCVGPFTRTARCPLASPVLGGVRLEESYLQVV